MPRRKVTGEVLEGMAELRKRGLTYGEIAGKLKVCPKTVAEHMRKAGLGGMRKVTGEVLERMRELRAKGLTYKEIAGKTGLSLPTVVKYMGKGRLEGGRGKAGSLEKFMVKMKKWEPVHRVSQDEVSIGRRGIGIFAWATGHLKGYREVDLYVDDKRGLLGIKPVAKGQRNLAPRAKGRGFVVVCAPLMRQIGMHERKRVPAEWSEGGKMLLVDLRGYRGAKR